MYVDSIDTTSLFVDYLSFYRHEILLGDVKDAWVILGVTGFGVDVSTFIGSGFSGGITIRPPEMTFGFRLPLQWSIGRAVGTVERTLSIALKYKGTMFGSKASWLRLFIMMNCTLSTTTT